MKWKRKEHSIELSLGDGLIKAIVSPDLVVDGCYKAFVNGKQIYADSCVGEKEAIRLVEEYILSKFEILSHQLKSIEK